MLLLMVDMAGTDGRAPWDDYAQLLTELELHSPSWLKTAPGHRQQDGPPGKRGEPAQVPPPPPRDILKLSAEKGEGIDKLLALLKKTFLDKQPNA